MGKYGNLTIIVYKESLCIFSKGSHRHASFYAQGCFFPLLQTGHNKLRFSRGRKSVLICSRTFGVVMYLVRWPEGSDITHKEVACKLKKFM